MVDVFIHFHIVFVKLQSKVQTSVLALGVDFVDCVQCYKDDIFDK